MYIEKRKENERIEKLEEEELKVYTKKINEQYEYLQKISKSINDKCGDYVLNLNLCIGGETPFIIATFFLEKYHI